MRFLLSMIFCLPFVVYADTIDHYMNISNQIPQMELKADQQAQIWARSARHVLTITDETIAETLIQANDIARQQGYALFCLPPTVVLNADMVHKLIDKTYNGIPSRESDKDKMTISQIAWLGILQAYPCSTKNDKPISRT